ncbi:helix-turn-helix transcriptional regulator [Natronoarchaeum sp. GCM10025703]|uniref:helix-turn-helix transcriptional regulator n=1 Tax=Natronoarchaeum sp. GCM10025703 TaxID=3252685 RepID=UPI00366F94EC
MNVRQADYVALAIVGAVLVIGLAITWQNYQQWVALGDMSGRMGMDTTSMHGTHPVWYLLGTLVTAAAVGGGYLALREQFVGTEERTASADSSRTAATGVGSSFEPDTAESSAGQGAVEGSSGQEFAEGSPADTPEEPSTGAEESGQRPNETTDAADTDADSGAGPEDSAHPTRPLLDVLPEDERRILQPVVDSPGLTQIELRDRADFSKSKVSQTVSDLEKRGLLYREPQGRTYRIYPSDDLDES